MIRGVCGLIDMAHSFYVKPYAILVHAILLLKTAQSPFFPGDKNSHIIYTLYILIRTWGSGGIKFSTNLLKEFALNFLTVALRCAFRSIPVPTGGFWAGQHRGPAMVEFYALLSRRRRRRW